MHSAKRVERDMDTVRIAALLDQVALAQADISKIYRTYAAPLDAEQAVLQKLTHAASALTEARDLAYGDKKTWASLERARTRVMRLIIESAHTCVAFEEALVMIEAERSTKH